MYFSKVLVVISALIVLAASKVVKVQNKRSNSLLVSVGGSEYTVAANSVVAVTLDDEWSGSISAIPVDAEVTDGPKTQIDFSLSTAEDSYSVSLLNGFNLPVKVIATGSTACTSSVCAANILRVCPTDSQVLNSTGTVVACQNSPLVMSNLCPLAVVDELTSIANVQKCTSAVGYLVLFV
ncbi:thaumatin-like protein 1 [Sitophilus oryzae]|uniref:Thaumatin-like protein 1 n=1 Tax=Sitophilus oryzae TaxID=7048 RepID=A0A6J2YAI8_SITOR|nr:thaumatin-like protein 1 [Sitophilus oryzae]